MELRPLTQQQATALWEECLPEVAWLTSFLLRERGLRAPFLSKPQNGANQPVARATDIYRLMTAENDLFSETLQIIATHYCEQAKRTTSLAWLASPRGCLFRIVQRDCRDTHRRELKKRTLTLPFDDRLAAQTEVPDEQISSEEHSFRRERLALIDQFISGLNDRDRRILQAKISRTPCRQLAAALNENEGRLRTQACRLWARLKRHIQIRTAAIKRAA